MLEGSEEEKLKFLKREEIKTMQKDVARLREVEAQKERERISALEIETKGGARVEEETKVIPPSKIPEVLLPNLPPKPPFSKKILVRAVIFFIVVFLLSFFIWYLSSEKPKKEEVKPPVVEETPKKPEIPIPSPLIPVEKVITLEVTSTDELPAKIAQLTEETLSEDNFAQIAIKNTTQGRLISLEELSQAFQINTPEEFFKKLEDNFTPLLFSQKEGKRLVLITKVKEKEGLLEILKNWEGSITKNGLFVSGEKISLSFPSFRTAFYQNVGFRYLTISQNDLGVCYAWFGDYFVLTTSFKGMKKAIDEVKFQELDKKIGQLFIVGFEGKTLTPQLEEFFKKYRPGGVLLLSKNIESAEQLKTLISSLQTLSLQETGLPLFVAVDQEGGEMSRIGFLEEKTPQSQIQNTDEAYQIGQKRGQELKELGVNLNLAPLLDSSQEGDFLFSRSFQKSPEEIGDLSKAIISGQKTAGILTAIKHFPGYYGISFNPEGKLAVVEKVPEFSQFKKAVTAKPELVMASNVIYKEIDASLPFTFSPKGIQFLKNNLGSGILIVSDDLSQNSLLDKFSLKEVVMKPIEAGVDILIFSGYRTPVEQGLDAFWGAVKNKEVSEIKINTVYSRIIKLKDALSK